MMLQKEKSKFETFDWYTERTETAKKEPVLSWINDARTDFLHRQALEPKKLDGVASYRKSENHIKGLGWS